MGLFDELLKRIDERSSIWQGIKSGFTAPRDAYMGDLPRFVMDEYGNIRENPAFYMRPLETAMLAMGGGMMSGRPPVGALGSNAIRRPEGPYSNLVAPSPKTVEDYIKWANEAHKREQYQNQLRLMELLRKNER